MSSAPWWIIHALQGFSNHFQAISSCCLIPFCWKKNNSKNNFYTVISILLNLNYY